MKEYPNLDRLIHAHFNQDYDLAGETIEEIINNYSACNELDDIKLLRSDIARFVEQNGDNVDDAFHAAYAFDFDPKLWGHTATSFLMHVDSLLTKGTQNSS